MSATRRGLLVHGKTRLGGFSPARFVQVTVETEISSSEALGQENDLIGVPRKVFNDVEDGREHGRVVALNGDLFGEPPVRQEGGSGHGLTHGAGSFADNTEAVAPVRAENSLGRSRVIGCSSNAGKNPLSDVPFQMQQQVADRILVFRIACPQGGGGSSVRQASMRSVFQPACRLRSSGICL